MTCVESAEARRAAASGAARRRGSCLQEGAVPPTKELGVRGAQRPGKIYHFEAHFYRFPRPKAGISIAS